MAGQYGPALVRLAQPADAAFAHTRSASRRSLLLIRLLPFLASCVTTAGPEALHKTQQEEAPELGRSCCVHGSEPCHQRACLMGPVRRWRKGSNVMGGACMGIHWGYKHDSGSCRWLFSLGLDCHRLQRGHFWTRNPCSCRRSSARLLPWFCKALFFKRDAAARYMAIAPTNPVHSDRLSTTMGAYSFFGNCPLPF